MALVRYGAGIAEMSGSISGEVFARNRSGFYVRNRTKPINPNSAAQQAVRGALAQLTERWAETLTIAQRTAWNLYGSSVAMKNRLGVDIHLTGFNHYLRSNAFLARVGKAPVDAGPTTFSLPEKDPSFDISASEGSQQITVTFDDTLDWDNETGGYLVYNQGSPQNGQRNYFNGPWKLLSYTAGETGVPVASPVVEAAVFAMAENQRQWVFARILRADGRLSEIFRADCIVAA